MQNIYLPNRFHLTFPHDDSLNFDKTLNVKKKNVFAFTLFWLTFISFLFAKLYKIFSYQQ